MMSMGSNNNIEVDPKKDISSDFFYFSHFSSQGEKMLVTSAKHGKLKSGFPIHDCHFNNTNLDRY